MKKETLLILGASSDIGIALAHRFAKEGFDIQLAGRNSENLKNDCSDLKIRYNVEVITYEFDALDFKSHEKFIHNLSILPSVAISAIGTLGNQDENKNELENIVNIVRTNYEGVITILNLIGYQFAKRGNGTLIGISSVAGDRGRGSNYIYGSAKAGLTTFLSGLRNRINHNGVNVITVKPGYVLTKMTEDLNLPELLTTNPSKAADQIYTAYKCKRNIIYVTPIWEHIMRIIKLIPENIFKKMKL